MRSSYQSWSRKNSRNLNVTRFNLYYEDKLMHSDLSFEDATEVLQDLAEKFFSGENTINPNKIELKENN